MEPSEEQKKEANKYFEAQGSIEAETQLIELLEKEKPKCMTNIWWETAIRDAYWRRRRLRQKENVNDHRTK